MATSSGKRGRPVKEESEKVKKRIVFDLTESENKAFLDYFEIFKKNLKNKRSITRKDFFMTAISNIETAQALVNNRFELLKELAKYKSDFAHIGSNINQVAHIVNTVGYATTESEIANKLEEMNNYLQMVENKSNQILNLMAKFVKK